MLLLRRQPVHESHELSLGVSSGLLRASGPLAVASESATQLVTMVSVLCDGAVLIARK